MPEIDRPLLGNLYWLGEVCQHVDQLLFHLSGGDHRLDDEPTIGGEGRALPELSQRGIKGLALIGGNRDTQDRFVIGVAQHESSFIVHTSCIQSSIASAQKFLKLGKRGDCSESLHTGSSQGRVLADSLWPDHRATLGVDATVGRALRKRESNEVSLPRLGMKVVYREDSSSSEPRRVTVKAHCPHPYRPQEAFHQVDA